MCFTPKTYIINIRTKVSSTTWKVILVFIVALTPNTNITSIVVGSVNFYINNDSNIRFGIIYYHHNPSVEHI